MRMAVVTQAACGVRKKSGWRTEPHEVAAFREQMEKDKPTKRPEKEPSKVQGEPENVMSGKTQEGRVINYITHSKEIQ